MPTWLHISTSSFWNRSLTHRMWAKAICFDYRPTKTTCRPTPFLTRPGLTLGMLISASTRPSWRQNYIAMSCSNNAKVEGLNVTLDDPAGCMRTDLGEWSDVFAWFIRGWIMSWTACTSEGIVRLWERFLNQLMTPRTNAWTISKADNNNDYDCDQASGEKQTGQRQYIISGTEARIRSLVTESGSEV